MNIIDARVLLANGKKVRRSCWGDRTYLRLYDPYNDEKYKVSEEGDIDGTLLPCVYIRTEDNTFSPWNPIQNNIFADDWELYIE